MLRVISKISVGAAALFILACGADKKGDITNKSVESSTSALKTTLSVLDSMRYTTEWL